MTTVVTVKKRGLACIAADTLARYGSTCESADYIVNSDKILLIGDSWVCPTGPASAQLVLRSYFADLQRRRDFSSLDAIFETMREMQTVLKEEYHLNPKEEEGDAFDSMQMEIMIASPAGIFGAYPLRSIQEYSRFYAFGSGATYALGAMHAVYDRLASAEEIAAHGIQAAAAFDDSTRLPYTVHTLQLAVPSAAFHRAGAARDARPAG